MRLIPFSLSIVFTMVLAAALRLPTSATVAVEPQGSNQGPPVPATVAPPTPGLTIDGEVVRVIDGDTIVVRSSIEYQIRLLDCWAPESRTRDAEEKARGMLAKGRMQQLAPVGHPVRVSMRGHTAIVEMITMGRILGRVWRLKNGIPERSDLSGIMVSEGLATESKEVRQ